MKKLFISVLLVAFVLLCLTPVRVSAADSLQIRPLLYKENIDKGESKRGAVDIANGSNKSATYTLSVKLFRQVGDDGTLEFYDEPDVTSAIGLDATSLELKEKESARVVFTIDGSKLPQGDVFAVILVTTNHDTSPQTIVPAAQVGTLLVLQNGKPGPREAKIVQLDMPWFQTGEVVRGSTTISNPAEASTNTGFFPEMSVRIGSKPATDFQGPLVYASRSRTFDFSVPSSQFGIHKVTLTANGTTESKYVFLITGSWRLLAVIAPMVLLVASIVLVLWRVVRYRGHRRHTKHSK